MRLLLSLSSPSLFLLLLFLSFSNTSSEQQNNKATATAATAKRSVDRSIVIYNGCGDSTVEILWVHPDTGEESRMAESVFPGTEFILNSYVGHKFVAREKPPASGGDGVTTCRNDQKVCRQLYFEVTENDDQMFKIDENFEVQVIDNKIKAEQEASAIIAKCKAEAQAGARSDDGTMDATSNTLFTMEQLTDCVETKVAYALEKVNEEIAFQSNVRRDIASKLENYTCLDDSLNCTDDIDTELWVSDRDSISRTVHIKHERPASRIHVIEKFISEEECDAMSQAAAKGLHRATVADGKGGSELSENRKAMQAGIIVKWDKEKDNDPIARLSRRVYDYTNRVLGLGIEEHGQEDLMSIQYFGRGLNDEKPDQYTPHCDGECTGLKHKYGTRMATMVMYCTAADKGGHTNFRNAGVHVKPQIGDAIFFSYIDPKTMTMDTGFTEHSGCPVFEGKKKIVTQWIRYGVDNDNPWDSFNTLGIKNSEFMKMNQGSSSEAQLPADAPSEEQNFDDYDLEEEDDEGDDDLFNSEDYDDDGDDDDDEGDDDDAITPDEDDVGMTDDDYIDDYKEE